MMTITGKHTGNRLLQNKTTQGQRIMKLKLSIDMNNAAFEEFNGAEAARILNELADEIQDRNLHTGEIAVLRDINGNRVGQATVVTR